MPNLRKVWDDIVPRRTAQDQIPYALTRQAIELYCKSVGEDHPVYFDEAYAKTTRYGGLIAPPSIHILLMFACTPADDWMRSPGTVNAGQSWSYHISARPGDVITLASPRARQVHQARAAVRGARQCLFFQPAWRSDRFRPRPRPSGRCKGERFNWAPAFENLQTGDAIDGPKFAVSRRSIRLFCDALARHNPLHLDDYCMAGDFGKTNFRRHHHARHEQFRADLADDHRLGPIPAGAVHQPPRKPGWVKPVRPRRYRHPKPTGIVKSETVSRRFALVPGRRHGAQPA